MTGILQSILCFITAIGSIIQGAAVEVVNFLIFALAGLLIVIKGLLPTMPTFPDLSSLDLSWLPYFIPVSSIVGVIGIGVTLFATMFGLRIGLRWIKAL